jgi:hypothetical protein
VSCGAALALHCRNDALHDTGADALRATDLENAHALQRPRMSRQNVQHYIRFKDQMKVAADGRKRLQIVGKED